MLERAKAVEIATALGVDKRVVTRRASREQWPFLNDRAKGGTVKLFFTKHLPTEIRVALAKHRATGARRHNATSRDIGVEASEKIIRAKAAQRERNRINREQQLATFSQLSKENQDIAYARRDVMQACDGYLSAAGADNKKQGIAEFCTMYNNGEIRLPEDVRQRVPKVSVSTMMRWQRAYKEHGPAGLANNYHNPKKGSTSLKRYHRDFAISMLVAHPHCSIQTVSEGMKARFNGSTPNISAIRRFVNRWKIEHKSLFLYMSNPDAWKSKHMFAFGQADEQIERLNQRWEFDSTPTDVMLADGRHNLIGVIDVYTRRFKLFVSKTSKSSAVAALVRRTILDWGVPESVKTDNGADYVSKHLVGVFEAMEIEQILCPPFTPEAKPHIERAFRTFSHGIVELLPGYVGHSVADRKAIEARRSFADRLMKRGEGTDPVEVNMTAEELQHLCDRWCEAIYHQNKHSGLDDRTPAEVTRAWVGTEKRINDERALDILLAESPRDSATVTKKGVRIDRRYYISEELAGLEGEKLRVKLDPTDLGTIYLFEESGRFLCTAIDPLRLGHDRAEIAAKTKAIQKQLVREGSRELKKLAREQATATIHQEILEYREEQIKNIVPLPRRAEEYTTPAIEEAIKAVQAVSRDQHELDEIDEIILDGGAQVITETEPNPEPKNLKVTPLFASDVERYNWIKTRERKHPGLTREEFDWLSNYYQQRSGRMYLELEGDMREKLGLRRSEAEG